MASRRILIVGGSTRAAADSVRRAGWQPICADCFADLDLHTIAQVIPVTNYPDSIPDDVAQVHADAWFYCGAFENHPEIVERMTSAKANYGPLLGTAAETLRLIRNPYWLMETLRAADLPALDVSVETSPPLQDGSWMQKPLSSAGGRSIRVWDQAASFLPFDEPHYFQACASGVGLSALFRIKAGIAEWLGASRELTASEFDIRSAGKQTFQTSSSDQSRSLSSQLMSVPTRFSYVGSCGPLERISFIDEKPLGPNNGRPSSSFNRVTEVDFSDPVSNNVEAKRRRTYEVIRRQLTDIAQVLMRNAPGLRGIIGLDFRFDGQTAWLTEVNPRYTASVEILELATGRSLLDPMITAPVSANELDSIEPSLTLNDTLAGTVDLTSLEEAMKTQTSAHAASPSVVAKRILYASSQLRAPDLRRYLQDRDPWHVPVLADIPAPGTIIEPGWPICTVMASGHDEQSVEAMMTERLREIRFELKNE